MANGFGSGDFDEFLPQSKNPAAPKGAQQMAGAAHEATRSPSKFADAGDFAQFLPKGGTYAEGAQAWYTGANREGYRNGWDTNFAESFVSGWDRALSNGQARDYYDLADATGVATWDHTTSAGKEVRFGDVYEHGKKTGNLYDLYDRDTANLMMAPWVLDNDVQERVFTKAEDQPARMDELNREVRRVHETNNADFEKKLGAMEFAEDVKGTAKEFQAGVGDEATVLGAAAAGAAMGSFFGPVGTAVGALAGGVGAYMNRDSLAEQAARAYEITKLSYAEHGLAGGVTTGISQWSGFGGKLIVPLGNLTQGFYDVTHGDVGDGEAAFYAVGKRSGVREAGITWKVADVTAAVGDSLIQFATPMGAAMFTAQMSGVVGGEVSELAATGGETFDYRTGSFDNIFTDDDGNFDASAASAGILKVGIDAVQLGMGRGVLGKTNAQLTQVGKESAYRTVLGKAGEKLPLWMGGSRGLAQGEERVRAGAFSFTRGADGAIVDGSRRATLGFLAPSEQLSALSARVIARREAAKDAGRAVSADDFYNAAIALAHGERKVTSALVNGIGEGYEEAMQAILEPHSHGGSIDAGQVLESAIYGAAGGAGMSLGAAMRAPSVDEQMFYQARLGRVWNTGGADLELDEWKAMSPVEKRQAASLGMAARETMATAYRKVAAEQAREVNAGVEGVHKLADAIETQKASDLARATDRTDGAFVITQLESAPRVDADGNVMRGYMPVDAAGASAMQTITNLDNHLRGVVLAHRTLTERLTEAEAALAEDPVDAELAAEVTKRQLQVAQAEATIEWGQRLNLALDAHLEAIMAADTYAEVEAQAAEINELLRKAFTRELNDYQGEILDDDAKMALARAVSLVFVRDPQDQSGSFQVLLPQVSAQLTAARTDNLLQVSHAILPAIRGDYDGDKMRQQAQLIFDDVEFGSARSGAHFIGAGSAVNVGAPKYEKYVVEYLAEALEDGTATLRGFAEKTLQDIAAAVRRRYDGVVEDTVLDEVLDSFFAKVRAADKDARAALLDGLADQAGGQLTEFGRANLSSEWLWLDQLIVSNLQRFQESYAAHRPRLEDPNTTIVSPNQQQTEVRARKVERLATLGQTLGLWAPGDTMFRKFQKLHYTAMGAPVLSAQGLEAATLTEMAELYRELGQQVAQSELDRIQAADDISGKVYIQLERIAADAQKLHPELDRNQALVVVANMAVADLRFDVHGEPTWDGHSTVSVAQMLMRQAIMDDKRQKARILDASPELKARHARLEKMVRQNSRDYPHGAEETFVEVVGSQQLYTLLGDDAGSFGPHLTVEQFLREYVAKSTLDRRDTARMLQGDPAYLGTRKVKDMPYRLEDVTGTDAEGPKVSAFRSVVDAILAVGNERIYLDGNKVGGEIADRSRAVGEDFRAAHKQIRKALAQLFDLGVSDEADLNRTMVRTLLDSRPDLARQVMSLIPNAAAAASFEVRGDHVYASNWLFDMFAEPDSKAAEMIYWRNLLIAQWNALGMRQHIEEEGADARFHARQFDRLPRRMHRIMYRLAKEPDGGMLYQTFINKLESMDDVEGFLTWVNTTPGILGEQAPIVAWYDDVADFDADKARGGWTQALPGAELREAITMLRSRAEAAVDDLVDEKRAMQADERTRAAIRRVLKKDAGEEVVLDPDDRRTYAKFVKAIEVAGDWMTATGPQEMLAEVVGAARGFNARSHTKGTNPPNVAPAGSHDAGRDQVAGYVTNYERLMASLTAVNIDAVGNALGQVAKDDGRTMDDYGRQVEWTKPTPAEMLDLLDNPKTRPYARAILFPQVMERTGDGRLIPQYLVGKSLTSLLDGSDFKALFARNDSLSRDSAFRYDSMLEGVARKFGGHTVLKRLANDIVIARTAAADHMLTDYELEQLGQSVMHEIAHVMQYVGAMASVPGTDMSEIMAEIRATQRRLRVARLVGIDVGEADDVDAILDMLISEQEKQRDAEISRLIDTLDGSDPQLQVQVDRQYELHETFLRRMDLLRTDDTAGQVAEMFLVTGDPTTDPARKQAVLEYVTKHLPMLESAVESKLVLRKLTRQMLNPAYGGWPRLEDKEWALLSRSVIGHYMDRVASTTAPGVAVSPWPDADHEDDTRYLDMTWSYLVQPMLDENGPLLKAAVEIHRLAGRQNDDPPSKAKFFDLLGRTILDGARLGAWTSDIPRASIEANSRLDSAAAEAAIAIPGNSPKRQIAIMAATRRTFFKPDEALLSKVQLHEIDLRKDLFDEVSVLVPGGALGVSSGRRMPLAQLNNRFARSVTLTYVGELGDGMTKIDLLAESPQLGRKWFGDDSVRDSGYYEISVDRLKRAVDQAVARHGIDRLKMEVEVEFFHPDDQPATVEGGPNWHNNVYFEGTSFKLDADRHESLISTLWFTQGSISPENQAAALDASKLGLSALQVIKTVPAEERKQIESQWRVDLGRVLRMKTQTMLATDLGFGKLDVEFYNAVYKDMKLRHFVRGTVDGQPVLFTAEDVIRMQKDGEALPADAELWIPSDDVLRSMLGEQGTQGVDQISDDPLQIDPSRVPAYAGVSAAMLERFGRGVAGETQALVETKVSARARQSQLTVRTKLDEKERNAFDARMQFFAELQRPIHIDRGEAQRTEGVGFNASKNLARAVSAAGNMLSLEDLTFHWTQLNLPIGPRNPEDQTLTNMLLRDLKNQLSNDTNRTGWIFREGAKSQPLQGLLSQVDLGSNDRPAYRIAPGDLVVVELDSFAGDKKLAKQRLDYFADRGAIVVLSAGAATDVRVEMAEHMMGAKQYEPIAGSQHTYMPAERGSRYQNQRARVSTLTATEGISARSRIAVLSVSGLPVHENAAWAIRTSERLNAIAVSTNLVPVSAMAGVNVPVTPAQIAAVKAHLRGFDNPEGRKFLRDQAHGKLQGEERAAADEEFDAAFDKLLGRFDDTAGSVLPPPRSEFGKGHIIPLVDQQGRVILYRHGMKGLERWEMERQFAKQRPSSLGASNVAVFPTKLEPAATVHTGQVAAFRHRAGYGLTVELEMPLSVFGDKKQLEWNGMKYVLTPKGDDIVLPDHGFFPEWGIDIIGSADDALSKESVGDMVDNHRNAFAYFGIDFLPDVTEFFFPGKRNEAEAQAKTREILHTVATRGDRISVLAADELINAPRADASFAGLFPAEAGALAGGTGYLSRLADQSSVESQIAHAVLTYLLTPGARPEDVLRSGGFNAPGATTSDKQSRLMPRLFTQIFDHAELGSPLRREMNRRFNEQLHNPKHDGTGYRLLEDFTFQVLNADPGKNLEGFLQFAEAHSAGDNPVKNGMSFDETARQQVSQHSAAIAYGATGAETAYAYDIAKVKALLEGAGVVPSQDRGGLVPFEGISEDGTVWRMFTNVPATDESFKAWRAQTPAEAARRENARAAMVLFRQEIEKDNELWGDDEKQRERNQDRYRDLSEQIVTKLNLKTSQVGIVDFWVRQLLGMYAETGGTPAPRISAKAAVEAAREILDNVTEGYLPVLGGEVPQTHLFDLQAIYRANKNHPSPWRPREAIDGSTTATDWNSWVEVSLGSALTSDNLFDPVYLLALDGFVHTYQNATRSLMDLPVSVDALVAVNLLDRDLNRMVVSISEDVNLLATDPILFDQMKTTVEELVGQSRITGQFAAKMAPASEIARRRDERRKWRKERDIPIPVDVTMKNFRKNGAEFIDAGTTTNAFVRALINLRVGTALLNPALYVSMGPEQWIRGGLDRLANTITGQATTGATAQAMARLGIHRFEQDELTNLGRLYAVMGQRADFKRLVYGELHFRRPHEEQGMGHISRGLEAYARLGSRVQDPTWGMRADTLARRYMEGALQHILATPTLNVVGVNTLVAQMMNDPLFLKKNYPDAHRAGSNAIAQIRSLKETTLSRALRGIYEPLSESSNAGLNFFGNVVLKVPMLFSGYAMNVATTITGLQGLDQMAAMWLDGRQKGPKSIIGRMQAKLKHPERPFDPAEDAAFDMSSVIEGIDLSRAFIRGGLTHAGLFAFGLMAGGLGLSGEDDEMKKRRLMAEHQGVGDLYDPRRIENDFRNADAMFFDFLPPQLRMGQPHWMLRQFLSPIMGMEKFYETGDFRHVGWGFEDALGAFPLINTMMWREAVETVGDLTATADAVNKDGTPAEAIEQASLLTTAVGVYERMLFENSFVNQLYIGFDEYDRNPYALPLTDSDGTIQRDIEGNARQNDLALESFINDDGEVQSGYIDRSKDSASRAVLAENRATLALISSLFTGGLDQSSYWRYNMPIKTRTIEKQPMDRETAERLVKEAVARSDVGNGPNITADEIKGRVANVMYAQAKASGTFDPNLDDKIWDAARQYEQGSGALALSIMDDVDGYEKLTKEGAKAVYLGLMKQSVKLGDESLRGAFVPMEMRREIANDWTKEIVQEGIDLGLDETKAVSRMKRIMYGEYGTDQKGLADVLFAKPDEGGLGYEPERVYAQLNTTYVMGPDGRPWATGFSRDKLMGALGLKPFSHQIQPDGDATKLDGRGNVIDLVNGNNTGLRAIEPIDDRRYVPTDVEIGKAIEDAIKEAAAAEYEPFKPFEKDGGGGSGWKNYGGSGWRNFGRGGYGGYGGGGGSAYFSKMYSMPDNQSPYGNNVSFINTSNPILRRATVRRERVWSERGRLKQWQ